MSATTPVMMKLAVACSTAHRATGLQFKNFSGSGLAVIASVKAHAKISVGM